MWLLFRCPLSLILISHPGVAVFSAALWRQHGKELKPPVSELSRGSFSPHLVFRDQSLGHPLDCRLLRVTEPRLNAPKNDEAKRGDGRHDIFKQKGDDPITEHGISSIFPFAQKCRQNI